MLIGVLKDPHHLRSMPRCSGNTIRRAGETSEPFHAFKKPVRGKRLAPWLITSELRKG